MYLRVEPAALSEKGAGDEPETVADGKLVLDHVALGQTRMRIVPLVGAEARHHEQGEAHEHVGGEHVEPDLDRQWIHEGEKPCRLTGRHLNYVTLRF